MGSDGRWVQSGELWKGGHDGGMSRSTPAQLEQDRRGYRRVYDGVVRYKRVEKERKNIVTHVPSLKSLAVRASK